MRKKFWFFQMVLVLGGFITLGLASCGNHLLHAHNYKAVKFDEHQHLYVCESCGKEGNLLTHNYETKTYNEPTEETEGLHHRNCECGHEEEIVLPKITIGTEGLEYKLNSDQKSYSVAGIGTANVNDIVIVTSYNDLPVTGINDSAFNNLTNITSIMITDRVTSIGNSAFQGCSSLTIVSISSSVTSIGNSAFNGCSVLKDVYYTGTEEQWKKINIASKNDELKAANIHYSYNLKNIVYLDNYYSDRYEY